MCLESEAVVSNELWTDLLRRLADTLRRVAAAAGSDECLLAGEGSVLGFVALLFADVAKVARRKEAVAEALLLLRAALDAHAAAAAAEGAEEGPSVRLLLEAFGDMWHYVDDSDEYQQQQQAPAPAGPGAGDGGHVPGENALSLAEAKAELSRLEEKQKQKKYVPAPILKRLREQIATAESGGGGGAGAGEAGDGILQEPGAPRDSTERERKRVQFGGVGFEKEIANANSASRPVVPELNLSGMAGHHSAAEQGQGGAPPIGAEALSLAEEEVLNQCMAMLDGNPDGAGRNDVIRLIVDIRTTQGSVTTEAVIQRMFEEPLPPPSMRPSAPDPDHQAGQRLKEERLAQQRAQNAAGPAPAQPCGSCSSAAYLDPHRPCRIQGGGTQY